MKRKLSVEEVRANTAHLYQALFPSMEQLMNPILRGNAVQQRLILCYGRQGSGKSAKAETIVAHAKEVYGAKNVAVQVAQGEGFREILGASKWSRRMITVLVLHDCTNVKFREEELRDFWRIRHIMQAKTGLNRGLVLLIFTAHTFFELPPTFRTDTDIILMSDMPTNPFHKQQYKTFFIPDGEDQERLRTFARERVNNPNFCGYAYMLDHGEPAGFIYLPQIAAQKKHVWPKFVVPSVQVNVPERRDLFVPLIGLLFLLLSVYSLAVRNFTGALFWGFFIAAIGLSWMLVKRRRG